MIELNFSLLPSEIFPKKGRSGFGLLQVGEKKGSINIYILSKDYSSV